MFDLAHLFLPGRSHHFEQLCIHHMVVNPEVSGYPPVFLICRELRSTRTYEFAIGISFLGINRLLMQQVPNEKRLILAEQLAESICLRRRTSHISVVEALGAPLLLERLTMYTRLRRFHSGSSAHKAGNSLYYFELVKK